MTDDAEDAERTAGRLADDLAGCPVPVLRASARALARLAAREENVNPREVAHGVLRDPLLTLAVLRYLATHHSSRMLEGIATVEHAVMMIGVRRFFTEFGAPAVLEDVLAGDAAARVDLLGEIRLARAASLYAGALASLRADPAPEQVAVAALLRNFAGLLLGCHAPEHRTASASVRTGLQRLLAQRWGLPELTLALLDEAQAGRPRVRTVAAAAALAVRAEQGWQDPALEADLAAVARLTGAAVADARAHVFDATLRVIEDRAWYGADLPPPPLPPLPSPGGTGADPAQAASAAYELALGWLDGIARGRPLPGHPRGGLVRDTRHDQLAAVAALMHGITAGCGHEAGLLVTSFAGRWRVVFRAGTALVPGDELPEGVAAALEREPGERPVVTTPGAAVIAIPILVSGEPCAVALALAPCAGADPAPDAGERLRALVAACESALAAPGAPAFWNSRTST